MRIAVIGGGPGGLLASTLLKRGDPSREVVVFERNAADDTFGFGVVFSDATLGALDAADAALGARMRERGVHWDPIEVRLHGERWRFGGNGMAAVRRVTLLHLLQRAATDAGVDVRFRSEVDAAAVVDGTADGAFDLVVAADGAHSRVRALYPDVFAPSVDTATAKFIWFGTTYGFDGLTFVHERSPHGVFAVHGYPIGDGLGTFLVETDEQSWREAGLDAFDTDQPPGPSDEASRTYLEKVFADQVGDEPLLTNNSRWSNFRTRRTERWSHRVGSTAIVLLGDAAHTAHFSVGSGTKMAMEDAIALAAAVDAAPDELDGATAAYEAERRPSVDRIQDSARPSLSWWEHFGRTHDHLPPWQFAFHFFSRSLPESKLRVRDARFVDDVLDGWHRTYGAGDPLAGAVPGSALPGRVVDPDDVRGLRITAPESEAELPAACAQVDTSSDAVVVVSGGTALTRRLLCEHARFDAGRSTVLDEPFDEDVARTAVLSGRTDAVTEPSGGGRR